MPKVRLTKNELKAQRDALKRFQRYLPTLQLKKQQLQLEVRRTQDELTELDRRRREYRDTLDPWLDLWSDDAEIERIGGLLQVAAWRTGVRNVAGIDTPVFLELRFQEASWDLFIAPAWFDDALEAARKLAEFALRHKLLEEQLERLQGELRITTQRVNLFEKVKIPEARENIRRIRIYLGDQQTASVGRAKIAKGKGQVRTAQID
ncbi:MAG: V-type ATP synthase subunit D [Kiritimatiellaeota bacterium]|nr:V-type ATP synthase subunit D [Kiritimatiellota bacterium]